VTEKEILRRFKEDFDKIESPDLWDKIQEKKANSEPIREIKPKKRNTTLIYALAACLAVMIVGIGVLAVMMNGGTAPIAEPSQTSSPSPSKPTSQVSDISHEETSLIEQLTVKQIYGHFALSERKEEELQTIFNDYNEKSLVYEDDDYLYNFDDKGRLMEMILINHYKIGEKIAVRADIEKNVETVFQTYFPDENINDYEVKIEECPDASPRWRAESYLYELGVIVSYIRITFDEYGKMQYLSLPEATRNIGNISKEQAIQIALEEVQSGKYDFLEFDREDVKIYVEYEDRYGKQYYRIDIEDIPLDDPHIMTTLLELQIDIYTGEILAVFPYY